MEELRAAVPALYAEAAKPAGIDGIMTAIGPWFATYPQPSRTAGEAEAFWQGYAIVCGHMPEAAIHAGMKTWAARSESEFLPKPGALLELARTAQTPAFKLASRAHNVLQVADDMVFRQRIEDDILSRGTTKEAQAVAIRRMLAEFNEVSAPIREHQRRILQHGYRNVAAQRPALPYSGGTPAPGSALTPEMHAVMGIALPTPPEPAEAADFDF